MGFACGLYNTEETSVSLPIISVAVETLVIDSVANVEIVQTFVNNSADPVSAKYVIPLDEKSSVCEFQAEIGDRIVSGEVKEKKEAKREYQEAIAQGHTASLLTEAKDDIFELEIGCVAPGETVKIKIGYVTQMKVDGDAVRFFLPTSVIPRYTPADCAAAPSGPSTLTGSREGLAVTVTARMRTRITDISSEKDQISWERDPDDPKIATAKLAPGRADDAGDFTLLITCEDPHQPRVCIEQSPDGSTYAALVTLCPRFTLDDMKCEFIFVIDRSGSMDGSQIAAAREAMALLLRSLPQDSYFNIVGFGSSFEILFPESEKYSEQSLARASTHIGGLQANLGGTEIMGPLDAIAKVPARKGYARQIFILTDGEVSNTEQVISKVRDMCVGESRFFALGIGSGVSHHLVEGVARAGKGTVEYVQSGERMQPKVIRQLKNAIQPALSQVSVRWNVGPQDAASQEPKNLLGYHKQDETIVQQTPTVAPPVLSGELFAIFAVFDSKFGIPASIVVSASSPEGPLEAALAVTAEEVSHGLVVHRMMARSQIRELEEGTAVGHRATADTTEQKIVSLGVKYSLVSRHTSFIAVDRSTKIELPVHKPAVMILEPEEEQLKGCVYPNADIQSVNRIMRANIDTVLVRCDILESLCERSDTLSAQATLFEKQSKATKNPLTSVFSSIGGAFASAKEAVTSWGRSDTHKSHHDRSEIMREAECVSVPSAPVPSAAACAPPPPPPVSAPECEEVMLPKMMPSPAKPKLSPHQLLALLVSAQSFNGSFLPSQTLAEVFEMALENLFVNKPSEITDERIWTTVLAIAFMRHRLAALVTEWELLEKKAIAFVKSIQADLNLEDVITRAAISNNWI